MPKRDVEETSSLLDELVIGPPAQENSVDSRVDGVSNLELEQMFAFIKDKKPWVIIGAGPSGAMDAVIKATLFPDQPIFVLEKREEHVRNHGLKIWNKTSADIITHLTEIEKKIRQGLTEQADENSKNYFGLILENIDCTKRFFEDNLQEAGLPLLAGPFIRTKTISTMLQEYAEQLSDKNFERLHPEEARQQQEIINNNIEERKKTFEEAKKKCDSLFLEDISVEEWQQIKSNREKAQKELDKAKKSHIGIVKFCLGEDYEVTPQHLNKLLVQPSESAKQFDSEMDNSLVDKILASSSYINSAGGSKGPVRAVVFKEPEPVNNEVIQYLIEIKLDVIQDVIEEPSQFRGKKKPVLKGFFGSKSIAEISSDSSLVSEQSLESVNEKLQPLHEFVTHMVEPLLENGKIYIWNKGRDGTATLHILVEHAQFAALTGKENEEGKLGTYINPYLRLTDLPEEADVKDLVTSAISEVIGIAKFKPETLKVTTIPMQIYNAQQAVKVENGRLYTISGDEKSGLIFIEGANYAIYTPIEYDAALMKVFEGKMPKAIHQHIFDSLPQAFDEAEQNLTIRYNQRVDVIRDKKAGMEVAEKAARKIARKKAFLPSTVASVEEFKASKVSYVSRKKTTVTSNTDKDKHLTALITAIDLIPSFTKEAKAKESAEANSLASAKGMWKYALEALYNNFEHDLKDLKNKEMLRIDISDERLRLHSCIDETLKLINIVNNSENKYTKVDQEKAIKAYAVAIPALTNNQITAKTNNFIKVIVGACAVIGIIAGGVIGTLIGATVAGPIAPLAGGLGMAIAASAILPIVGITSFGLFSEKTKTTKAILDVAKTSETILKKYH